MAIAFRSGTEANATATSLAVNVPSGVQDGDVLVLWGVTADGDDGGFNTLTGWTQIVNNVETGGSAPSPPGVSAWWRVASSEPASYTITPTAGSTGICAQMMAFTGVDNTTPIDQTTVTATGDSTNFNPGAIVTQTDNALTLVSSTNDASVTPSAVPSGYTAHPNGQVATTGGGNGAVLYSAYRTTAVSPAGSENPGTYTAATEQWVCTTIALRPAIVEGITSIDPTEFDMDNTDIDINGLNFEASQGTGTVYISDADTLAGSANEVEIDGGINTWADALINLDLSGLSAGELANLHTLGPGQRYIIVVNDSADEYGSSAITLHRPQAFGMSLSPNFAPGATTYQLTAPATKSTTDFDAGRIEEVANPTTTVDITDDDYTEIEWCMEATDASREVQYDFRVTAAGNALATYTVTPQLTIGAAAGGRQQRLLIMGKLLPFVPFVIGVIRNPILTRRESFDMRKWMR